MGIKKITDDVIQKAIKLKESNMSWRAVAKKLNLASANLRVQVRASGYKDGKMHRYFSPDRLAFAHKMYASTKNYADVTTALTERFGSVAHSSVLAAMKKYPAPKRTLVHDTAKARGTTRMRRRSVNEIENGALQVKQLLDKQTHSMRAEEIQTILGLQRREMPRIMKFALADKLISKQGRKRATLYFTKGNKDWVPLPKAPAPNEHARIKAANDALRYAANANGETDETIKACVMHVKAELTGSPILRLEVNIATGAYKAYYEHAEEGRI